MALIKKSVTGMKDILPEEMFIRDYLINIIKKTYGSFGFNSIETPAMEHIENLLSKQGGDNEKLIFKILKRGEKLQLENINDENDLVDAGLRYDLTLPLARYYANNQANLPNPFKALQIGNVYRADRPQKGRFRQFTQCDIDILGEASNLAEIELILATTKALSQIAHGKKFTVRINDRRILMAMALYAGYSQDNISNVFIILDKMDKIGLEGVRKELNELDGEEKCEKYLSLFDGLTNDSKALISLKGSLSGFIEEGVLDGLSEIMNTVLDVKSNDFSLEFDPTLVRGMGYYTGTIFEVSMEGFSGSVAGGGRYDKMIGKFTGNDTAACGFSIGFERIITILMDAGFKIPDESKKIAFLYEKNIEAAVLTNILKEAAAFRELGNIVLVSKMNKNKKFQKEGLEKQGYTQFKEFYREALK
ncbi:histidine--tRNA ligase [Lachnoanaerobaculum sp. Marseille-Q4761]|uniref:histidine--tRNA ligase n=1 Tax=Lachnoanaerobaculum sp. Marseille-Q4761 TaxID=2819511 RepID=UPI001AA0EF7C|nr:histidine--tRNA ligase [Lachnoanaerobaculum sp. Marseille-Q4761]MBO1871487.1 histidine--tRNA ligase [Lachnoanaerobaculum sp. Marseille-Q4761]